MSDVLKPLDTKDMEARDAVVFGGRALTGRPFAPTLAEEDRHALLAEVKRLREALDGLVKINAEDFPAGPDGRINWSAFPVTFGYAKAYRAALVALGRETA